MAMDGGGATRRRVGRVARAASVVAVSLFMSAEPVFAHASLTHTQPQHGSSVPTPPPRIVLSFTEAIEPSLVRVDARTDQGTALRPHVSVSGAVVEVELEDLPERGAITVDWHVVSRLDGHVTAGGLAFGIAVPAPPTSPLDSRILTPASPTEIAGRWAWLGGLGLIASVVVLALVGRRSPEPRAGLAMASWGLAFIGLWTMLTGQWLASGSGLGVFAGSGVGQVGLRRLLLLGAAGAALSSWIRSGRPRVAMFALAATGGALFVHVTAGHAAGAPNAWARIGVQWAHGGAAVLWIGSLATAALVGNDPKRRAVLLPSVSRVATTAVTVVAATGGVLAWQSVAAPSDLVSTTYGRLVALKVVLFVAMAALGWRNRSELKLLGPVPGVVRRVRAEAVLGCVALAAVAALGVLVPPGSIPVEDAAQVTVDRIPGGPTLYTVRTDGGSLQVYADPERPGPAELHATFFGNDGLEAAVRDVSVTVAGQTLPEPRFLSPGHVVAAVELPSAPSTTVIIRATLVDDEVRIERELAVTLDEA